MRRLIVWGGKITKIQENAEESISDMVYKCNCNTYCVDLREAAILRKTDQLVCEDCENPMISVPIIMDTTFKAPYIKTSDKQDLQLDYSYMEDDTKKKHWSDLPGGMEEHADIHHGQFNDFHTVKNMT